MNTLLQYYKKYTFNVLRIYINFNKELNNM